ncbi:hypothetical protein ES705_08072 [subsurface metagenome]
MPECRCQSCGRHFFGWGVFLICNLCGGKLEPFNGTAKKKESEGDKGR